ncbi:hypothetical protein DPMN_004735 [Dreissena polymorpha]|uniref:Uncharacterized protein n=1 Tax=Dreissena polymorpha TaxID=45954 RepID=A0A9D4RVX8_DREPO|nr:hypothetical protein DPMN_004735 [Dreissena polymorpha]
MVEPTIWPALEEIRQKQAEECKTRQTYGRTNHLAPWEEREGRNREKSVRQDRPMVEPTIWPALEEIRQKQAEECKTRRTYGRINHLACLGGREGRNREKSVRQDGPMVEPTIWPALEEIRQKQAEECKKRQT